MYHFCCWSGSATPPGKYSEDLIILPAGISLQDAKGIVWEKKIAANQPDDEANWFIGTVYSGPDGDGQAKLLQAVVTDVFDLTPMSYPVDED